MVAIKDFGLHSCCESCEMCRDGYCVITENFCTDRENKVADDCPLVEIGTCKDCKQLGVMDCGYYCKLNHWGKISKEGNYGGMGDYYCWDFEKRGNENG